MVTQSGGTVRVRSAPGAGSTFVILLPRATGHDENTVAPVTSRDESEPLGQGTVLLVEDEGAVRSAARGLLARRGFAVLEARHGADALLVWREHRAAITAVVTDLRMPELGGREFVAMLRAEAASLPVVYVSGYAERERADAARPNETFLAKPVPGDALLGALARVIDASRRAS